MHDLPKCCTETICGWVRIWKISKSNGRWEMCPYTVNDIVSLMITSSQDLLKAIFGFVESKASETDQLSLKGYSLIHKTIRPCEKKTKTKKLMYMVV